MFRRELALFVGLAAAVVCSAPSFAQPFPSRPIRLVMSVGTGGVGDVTNRLFAQYMRSSWTGISVPAKTPSAIVDRLARGVARAAALSEVKRPLQDIGIEARASTPEETRKRMVADIARWRKVVEQANIERQ